MFKNFKNYLQECNLYEQMKIINNIKKGTKNNRGSAKEFKLVTNFTREEAIQQANILFNQHNYLTKDIFLKSTRYHMNKINELFGNFKNFMIESGIDKKIKNTRANNANPFNEISKEDIINDVKNLYNSTIKFTNQYYLKNSQLKIGISTIKKYFGTFTNMLKELNISINIQRNITKEEILEHMWHLYNKHGKLTSGIQRNDKKFGVTLINSRFGSFGNMLKEMGLKANIAQNVTTEELLNELNEIIKIHGTINSVLLDNETKYCRQTYLNRLGSLSEICEKLNIMYNCSKSSTISDMGLYCVYIFSKILNHTASIETTFDWLRNPLTNSKLKLDGYFEEYKLGIEYDGIQHYKYTPKIDKTYEKFQIRQARDEVKNQLCVENGIKLIRIKYDEPLTEKFIRQKLIEHKIIKE